MLGFKRKIEYQHKCLFEFPFIQEDRKRPKIEVDIFYIEEAKKMEGLVCTLDSGADTSVFPKDLGEKLGIDFSEITPELIGGIDGKKHKAYPAPINIGFLGTRIMVPVMWLENKETHPVIGREVFFDKFDIIFRQRSDKITMVFHQTPDCHHSKYIHRK